MAAKRKRKGTSLTSQLTRKPNLQTGYPTRDPETGKITVHARPDLMPRKKKKKATKKSVKQSTAIDRADQERRLGMNRGGSRMRGGETANYTPKGKPKKK